MVVLYTTDCPKCNVLKSKLIDKNITFTENHNILPIVEMGFLTAPVLKTDEAWLDFTSAINWLNEQKGV